ncbi:putative membrane protein [Candidatus Phytoplasma solani]|uniref:hypothetical protein n=1 Tax=Candidatus Phytoplasma solani TaxID=69896 RepID=UPI0032DA617D
MKFSLGRVIGFLVLTPILLGGYIRLISQIKQTYIPELTDLILANPNDSEYQNKRQLAEQAEIKWDQKHLIKIYAIHISLIVLSGFICFSGKKDKQFFYPQNPPYPLYPPQNPQYPPQNPQYPPQNPQYPPRY